MSQYHKGSCCTHHSHHHHHHSRRHHCHHCPRGDGSSSENGTEICAQVTKQLPAKESNPNPKKTQDKPWTWWMSGDGGQYYYRGRQKPTGEWEYEFMPSHASSSPKYSPSSYSSSGSTVSSVTRTVLPAASVFSYPGTASSVTAPTSYAASQISTAMSSMSLYPTAVVAAPAAAPLEVAMTPAIPTTQRQGTSSSTKKQCWPIEDEPRPQHKERKHVKVKERTYRGHSHHHHHCDHHHHHHHHRSSSSSSGSGKKIETLVTAEKDKRFSSKSIVSGWLGDVEEVQYEGPW